MSQPDSSETWLDPIFDAVVSDVQATGHFDRVNQHEPFNKPGYGLTAAVWVQDMWAIPALSGLASTTAAIIFMVRTYQSALSNPQSAIDPKMLKAVSNLMRRYHDDFDFAGAIRNVDLLGGATGQPLRSVAGYENIDNKWYRIMTLTIPVLVNDVWPQVK